MVEVDAGGAHLMSLLKGDCYIGSWNLESMENLKGQKSLPPAPMKEPSLSLPKGPLKTIRTSDVFGPRK